MRFGETFSPRCGTIKAHQDVIAERGYVWWGKTGATISNDKIAKALESRKILLIRSGKTERYWAYIEDISTTLPKDFDCIPKYYRDMTEKFKVWFKITKFELADKDVMAKCKVVSSGSPLSVASKHSMNPCFFIEYKEYEETTTPTHF